MGGGGEGREEKGKAWHVLSLSTCLDAHARARVRAQKLTHLLA